MPKSTRPSKKMLEVLEAIGDESALDGSQAAEDRLHGPKSFGYVSKPVEAEIGGRLRDAREAQQLTQGELAARTKLADDAGTGLTRNVISFIESGRTQPGPKEIRMLCEALRISPNVLIYGNEDPFSQRGDLLRHGLLGGNKAEKDAYLAYCLSKLHHSQQVMFINLMLEILRGWYADFDTQMRRDAIPRMIDLGKELEKMEAERGKNGS